MEYTKMHEDALYASWQFDTVNEDFSNVLAFLNNDFRSFGDGLKEFLALRPVDGICDPIKHLKALCVQADVNIADIASQNTLKDWFNGNKRPKKGETERKKMFAFAFALKLTPEETKNLFHKVYLDRAFNKRNYKELIYYHCLDKGYKFAYAEKLIERVALEKTSATDQTLYTAVLSAETEMIQNTDDLLTYIQNHQHNYSLNNLSAKEELLHQKELALGRAQKEAEEDSDLKIYSGRDTSSDSFLYYVITGQSVAGKAGTVTLSFKNSTLPKDIKNNFPQSGSFSNKVDSYEELRKSIVLLFSYWYWRKAQIQKETDYYDDYIDELNNVLEKAGLSPLYYGNPYDWMFLYCTNADRPLDTFRGLLADVLDQPE